MSFETVQSILSSSPVTFGTSGLRGLVSDLDYSVCYAVTSGFLEHGLQSRGIKQGSEIFFAHDLRPSSPDVAKAVADSIRDAGMVPVFCGTIPTPALALAGAKHNVPVIMITGSHIPFDRNGIKFFYPDGEMSKADEAPILSSQKIILMDQGKMDLPEAVSWPATLYVKRYIDSFSGLFEGLKIGHFQHSSVGRDLTAELLQALGAEVIVLERTKEFVPIDTEAVSQADRDKAIAWSTEHNLDLIFSTDGDGDRPLLADEKGFYFQGDLLGVFAARYLGAESVVTPVSSNSVVEQSGWFNNVVRTKIGSPYVIEGMTGEHSVVGYEANGGTLVGSDFSMLNGSIISKLPTRDALLPALATVALAKREKKKLSQLRDLLPSRFTCSDRVTNYPKTHSTKLIEELTNDSAKLSEFIAPFGRVASTDDTDGLRIKTTDMEIVHLRPSGNAPEFRVYVEAVSQERADTLLSLALKMIQNRAP